MIRNTLAGVLFLTALTLPAAETPPGRDTPTVVTLAAADLKGKKAKLAGAEHVLVVADGLAAKVPAGAGRVRVQAFLRYNGKGEAYRQTPFTLTVGTESAVLTVDALAAGQPLSVDVVNRGAPLNLAIRQGALPPAAITELRRLETTAATAAGPNAGSAKSAATGLAGLAELDEPTNASAEPVPMVLLDRVEITPLSGPLLVAGVTSDKLTYRPGDAATVKVVLENVGAQPVRGAVSVDFIEGLDTRRRVDASEVDVAAGAKLTHTCQIPVGTALWGRGIEAAIQSPSGTDRATHAFGVVTHPTMAAIAGRGLPQFGSERWTPEQAGQEAEKLAQANLANYANCYEAFAWAPCDFSQMTAADNAPMHSGQTQYSKSRSSLQILNRVFHKYGIACVTYGKACAAGLPGVQYALRHPEQMNVFSPAGFAHEAISVDVLDRMLEGRYRQHGKDEDFWQSWISSWVLMGNLDAANFGCDEIVRSAKMFDWDAVRYDGHFSVWKNPAMSARFVRHCAERIQSQAPGFGLGYNYCGPQHSTPEGAFTDIELAACARDGGLIMSEYYRGLLGPVKQNIDHLRCVGDATRLHGGYFLAISDDNSIWASALMMAGGARPMGGGTRFNKFATRFSAYVLAPDMRRLQDPGKVIHPGKNSDFRWDAFVYEKPVSSTESLLLMQLVNVTEGFSLGGQYRPPAGVSGPRQDIEFDLALPAGYQSAGVQAWDAEDEAVPMAAALTGNRLTIPRLRVWTLVAVKLRKSAEAANLPDVCEIPLHFDQAGGAAAEQSRADLKIGAPVGPDMVAAINAARTKITPAMLSQILAQGEPADNNPGAATYTPSDFTTHKVGVDAGLWKGEAAPLRLRRNGHPDVLVVRGVFSHLDRLEEALANLPNAVVHDAYLSNGRGACGTALAANNTPCLADWPDRAALAGMDVVILDEIPAPALSLAQRRDLLDFVQGGGSLVVLGGWYSLSKGAWEGSFLEEALPVEAVQLPHLLRLKEPDQRLVAGADFSLVLGAAPPDFGIQEAVEWINHIRLKSGAKVLMAAGTQPVLVAGACGEGAVFVWAGSHSGAPVAPYWEAGFWPKVLTLVLAKSAAGAAATTPPDPALASRLAAIRESMTGKAIDELLDPGAKPGKAVAGKVLLADLGFLLEAGSGDDAVLVARYLLEHPVDFDPVQTGELIDAIVPKITPSAAWAKLGERYVNDPPQMVGALVADIAAVSLKTVKYATIERWALQDPVRRLRCIAVSADPAALPALEAEFAKLVVQENTWGALVASGDYSTATVHDIYETRLRRPFIAYAMLRCGKRDEETLYHFCRGVSELPYYAWRQRWILDGARAGMADATRAGDPSAIIAAKGRIRAAQAAVQQLDRAILCARPLFRPEVVGTDAIGLKAAARALQEADCRRAMPIALEYLQALPQESLPAINALKEARLSGLRAAYRARAAQP